MNILYYVSNKVLKRKLNVGYEYSMVLNEEFAAKINLYFSLSILSDYYLIHLA